MLCLVTRGFATLHRRSRASPSRMHADRAGLAHSHEPGILERLRSALRTPVSDAVFQTAWPGSRPHQRRRHLLMPTPRSRQSRDRCARSSLHVRRFQLCKKHPIRSVSGVRRGCRRRTAEAIDRFLCDCDRDVGRVGFSSSYSKAIQRNGVGLPTAHRNSI
jgi:hypothetical protein